MIANRKPIEEGIELGLVTREAEVRNATASEQVGVDHQEAWVHHRAPEGSAFDRRRKRKVRRKLKPRHFPRHRSRGVLEQLLGRQGAADLEHAGEQQPDNEPQQGELSQDRTAEAPIRALSHRCIRSDIHLCSRPRLPLLVQ